MAAPELARDVDELLRRCIQCGLCLPHCATWLATGNEVQSPRGRLVLLGEAATGGCPDASFLAAFDTCIGCRACETACPSGVPFSLLERGQDMARGRVPVEGSVPGFLLRRLDRSAWLSLLRRSAHAGRTVLRLLAGRHWRQRLDQVPLARLLGSVPTSPGPDADLVGTLDAMTGLAGPWGPPEVAADRPTPVVLFRGCANVGLLPGSWRRTGDLLRAAGYEVVVAPGQDCCGALAAHTGRPGRRAALRRANRDALAGIPAETPVVVEAAGCGLELRGYEDEVAARVVDATVMLAAADLPSPGRVPLKVAIHDPCHLRHGQGIVDEPRILLGRIPGIEVLEPEEPEICCGSGGTWGLRYPEMSMELGRRKARLLAATGADLVVTTNPGCLGQIADGLALEAPGLPILPLTDLVWYAVVRGGESAPGSGSIPCEK